MTAQVTVSHRLDPMSDVDGLIADISDTGMDLTRPTFISFHLRLNDRAAWEQAATAARRTWQVSLYSSPAGYMLRLCRYADITRESVARLRGQVQEFVAKHGAVWESVTVEELSGTNEWKALQAQQRADIATASERAAAKEGASAGPTPDARPSRAGKVA